MHNVYSLFPVIVTHGKLPIEITVHKKIINFVDKEYETKPTTLSCIDGFQHHGEFEGKNELDKIISTYLNNLYKIDIANGWLNVLGNKSYNQPHSHANHDGTDSGVLYLSNDNNNITFTKDSEIFEIKPKLFDIILFPYNLVHYVLPEERMNKRICYAFNTKKLK
tara:strand:+ start:577 stop:1071 length:495 start_codon:yes stop_codon:yes gene_type:complete